MDNQIVRVAVPLEVIVCASCGMPFGVPECFLDERKSDHIGFCCPSGHDLSFHEETEADKLRKRLDSQIKEVVKLKKKLEK